VPEVFSTLASTPASSASSTSACKRLHFRAIHARSRAPARTRFHRRNSVAAARRNRRPTSALGPPRSSIAVKSRSKCDQHTCRRSSGSRPAPTTPARRLIGSTVGALRGAFGR
jgi:hypothetical protein